jgi:RNA polymerase sigma factor (sigma-70 family)
MGMPGNQRNVQKLVEEHYVALYRYAYRLTGSESDAEDLTQDTFCKAQMKLAQLRDPARAKNWLFSILSRTFLQRIRTDRRHTVLALEVVGDVPEALPDPLPDVDPEQLQRALNELPEVFRTAILLYYFEEFSYRDIAEQMDLPLGTVMSRLARAKAHLRARLLQPVLAEAQRRANHGLQ